MCSLMTSTMQEYPDLMLATLLVLPSPKVSETVFKVSHMTSKEEDLLCQYQPVFFS